MSGSSEAVDVPFVLVEDGKSLADVAARLAGESRIGVDVEADSMFHYDEKVCLIQLSTREDNFIVDPLKLPDLSPLDGVFSDPDIEKVFHGADFDVRSLRRDFSFRIQGLFDTQVAAKFLGKGDLGLAQLVRDHFGVDLEKKYRKRNWSARPLPVEMLRYGILDSFYLLDLAASLRLELEARGRLGWVLEECEILSRVESSVNGNGPLFERFKGAGRLDGRSLAVLEAVLRFRDSVAARRDAPHFKVMGNESVMDLVRARPVSIEDLKTSKILSPKQINSLGGGLIRGIAEALALPESDLPVYPLQPRAKRASGSTSRYNQLKAWRDRRAEDMDIDPSVVCSNTLLKAIAGNPPEEPETLKSIPGIRGWQVRLFGKEICEAVGKTPVPPVSPKRRRRRGGR